MLLYEPQSDTVVELAAQPFASGGEGKLYRIKEPAVWAQHVAKVYHPNKRSAAREAKLRYLMAHPPQLREQGHQSIIWPTALLYEQNELMGFLMPEARGKKLEVLCTPKLSPKLPSSWDRMGLGRPAALQLRLKLCYNIAVAVHQIHETGHYALVDLKPDNIMVQANGLISIVDSDSIEIIEGGKAIFSGRVATPEYTPPEYYQGLQPGKHTIFPSWDYFSLSIIFYRLLLGIHPFAASFGPPYEQATGLAQKIEAGLFVHGDKGQRHLKVLPPIHRKFQQLPPAIRNLFSYCFAEGHADPDLRPTAEEWCSAISGRERLRVVRPVLSEQLPQTANRQLPQKYSFEFEASPVLEVAAPKLLATRPPVSFGHFSESEKWRYWGITAGSGFAGLSIILSGFSTWVILIVLLFSWNWWRKVGQSLVFLSHPKVLLKKKIQWKLFWTKMNESWMKPKLLGLHYKRQRLNKRMQKRWERQLTPAQSERNYQEVQALYEQKTAFLKEKDQAVMALCAEEEKRFRGYRQELLEAFKHLKGVNLEHKIKRLEKQTPLSSEQAQFLQALKAAEQQLEQKRKALRAVYDKRYQALVEKASAEWGSLVSRLEQQEQALRSELDEQMELQELLKERYEKQVEQLRDRYEDNIQKAKKVKTRRRALELELQRYSDITLKNYKKRF